MSTPREVRDRREDGFAGVAGDLLSSGEGVLVVCADVQRRIGALERVLAGAAERCGGRLAAISWHALVAEPSRARAYAHVVALDPPFEEHHVALLGRLPCQTSPGFAHLAWGRAEIEFTLAIARARLELRPALASVYRELRAAGLSRGERLERILRGEGRYPRSAADCARLVRVLLELELVDVSGAGDSLEIQVRQGPDRAPLEGSPTYQSCLSELSAIRERFAGQGAQAA